MGRRAFFISLIFLRYLNPNSEKTDYRAFYPNHLTRPSQAFFLVLGLGSLKYWSPLIFLHNKSNKVLGSPHGHNLCERTQLADRLNLIPIYRPIAR